MTADVQKHLDTVRAALPEIPLTVDAAAVWIVDAHQSLDAIAAALAEKDAEIDAWHDWIDKPHKDDRWAALLALLPDEYQHIKNMGAEIEGRDAEIRNLREDVMRLRRERDEKDAEIDFKKKALRNCREAHLAAEAAGAEKDAEIERLRDELIRCSQAEQHYVEARLQAQATVRQLRGRMKTWRDSLSGQAPNWAWIVAEIDAALASCAGDEA